MSHFVMWRGVMAVASFMSKISNEHVEMANVSSPIGLAETCHHLVRVNMNRRLIVK